MRCAEERMKEAEGYEEWEVVGSAVCSLIGCMQEKDFEVPGWWRRSERGWI